MDAGVIYVAYGRKARAEASESIRSLRRFHDWPVLVVGDGPVAGARRKAFPGQGTPGRWAKVNLDNLTEWEHTLFLDADTRVHGRLDVGFLLLSRGYDLVAVPSRPQYEEALGHLDEKERRHTWAVLPWAPLQINSGVLWFGPGAKKFFEAWRAEWLRWKDKDQGALLRALHRKPVNIALLGLPFNDAHGEVVEHRFGECLRPL